MQKKKKQRHTNWIKACPSPARAAGIASERGSKAKLPPWTEKWDIDNQHLLSALKGDKFMHKYWRSGLLLEYLPGSFLK
jgi:hypothetical protein